MPYGLKDLFDTKGIVTGWGAEPFRDRVPEADATIVRKLRAAGAVLLGKTTVGALAYNDLWYGGLHPQSLEPQRRLERIERGLGVSDRRGPARLRDRHGDAGLDHLAEPALRNDRPSPDFRAGLPRRRDGLCWSLDKVGPICRSVEDTAIVLAASTAPTSPIAARSRRHSASTPRRRSTAHASAILPEAFGEGANEVDHAALAAARRLGVEVVEVAPAGPALWRADEHRLRRGGGGVRGPDARRSRRSR